MPKLRYIGPIDEVELPDGITVKRNHQIEVSDEVAGEAPDPRLAEAMVELAAAVDAHDHNAAAELRTEISGLDYGKGLLAQDTWEAVAKKDNVKKDEVPA